MIRVQLEVVIDEAKLDEFARSLYDGPEFNDPVPNEPHPGQVLIEDWIEEARAGLKHGHDLDLFWLQRDYVDSWSLTWGRETGGYSRQQLHSTEWPISR